MLSLSEVAEHCSRESCWVIINGQAYDVTNFLDSHPGGSEAILRRAGKDATDEYELLHPAGTMEKHIPPILNMGAVETSTIETSTEIAPRQAADRPGLEPRTNPSALCFNLDDFEVASKEAMSERAYAYVHSAADSLHSAANNLNDWNKITFRPRVLRDVGRVSMAQTIMGHASRLPFFIAPTALGKLVHPEGEMCMVRAAATANVPYCVSTYASVGHEELTRCLDQQDRKGGCLFFQLYVAREKTRTLELIHTAKRLGFKALVVTVDTPVVGKREEDERYHARLNLQSGIPQAPITWPAESETTTTVLRGVHSYTLSWRDLQWICDAWGDSKSVVLKGIQSVEDVQLACEFGVGAVYLSNHGGRQIDSGPSSIRTLLEINHLYPQALNQLEIYLDGGVRRGADILKALCLGARAVSIGRPFLYAMAVNGTEGVLKAMRILSDEIETTMRLLGVTALSQLRPEMINFELLGRELPTHIKSLQSGRSRL